MDISLDIDGVNICPKPEVRNPGAIFGAGPTMKPHVKSVFANRPTLNYTTLTQLEGA